MPTPLPATETRRIGSGGVTLTRLRQDGLELEQPPLPAFTLSILLAGRSRPWRDLGDGLRVPRGAEAYRHRGMGLLTPHATAVSWRVEGEHDCAVLAFPVPEAAAQLEELGREGVEGLTRLSEGIIRDPLLPVLSRQLCDLPEDAPGRLFADGAISLILALLARREAEARGRGTPPPPREQLAPRALRRAQDYLAAHLGGDPTLEGAAAAAGLSRFHFLRAFKASTGLTPFEWLRERRLAEARRLLAGTDLPLAQVALEVGLGSQSHFTALFRAREGITPGRFRREARG